MELNEKTLMRDVLVEFLRDKLATDDVTVVVDADLAKCAGTIALEKEFPDRALNVGIAEANMAGIAAGLSSYGFKPFITSFGPFASRRIADQAMISICYAKQNVKIVGTDPGIAAELNGGTHMPFSGICRGAPADSGLPVSRLYKDAPQESADSTPCGFQIRHIQSARA